MKGYIIPQSVKGGILFPDNKKEGRLFHVRSKEGILFLSTDKRENHSATGKIPFVLRLPKNKNNNNNNNNKVTCRPAHYVLAGKKKTFNSLTLLLRCGSAPSFNRIFIQAGLLLAVASIKGVVPSCARK